MMRISCYLLFIPLLLNAAIAYAYPLDGDDHTGITRLEGYRLVQEGKIRGLHLKKGARLKTEQVDLRLQANATLTLPAVDPQFQEDVLAWLGINADKYTISVLDLTQPNQPQYAEHNAHQEFSPGSVGKLMVAMALFQELADLYPDDHVAREQILRNSMIVADKFIRYDEHDVPFWNVERQQLIHRPLQEGDTANLWTYLDWMLSASSNAAASMVMKQLLLLKHFGKRYPVPESEANTFYQNTSKAQLGRVLAEVMQRGVNGSGLNTNRLRQGKFFTREGKRRVPGLRSYATPRELMRFLLHLEQGKVVDTFSSREIKRLMYITQKRIRCASHPAL
ncbi:MAG: serine hydrolase, partial [Gammaproteobacteria bacterium]|nr:serine hydrolase [Gammaproteobacteria bacterium]